MTDNGRASRLRVGVLGHDAAAGALIRDRLEAEGIECPEIPIEEAVSIADRLSRLDAAIVLLDGSLGTRAAAVKAARTALSGVPLVGVWGFATGEERERATRLGLEGLVHADGLDTTLAPTIWAVAAGLVCVPRSLRQQLRRENLSGREKQVLGMVVTGSTNAEIAATLFLAESTVKSHLSSAYEKLGVRSRTDAAALILDPSVGLDRGILAISAA